MMFRTLRIFALFAGFGIVACAGYLGFDRYADAKSSPMPVVSPAGSAKSRFAPAAKRDFGDLPLYFVANRGQAAENVKYYSVGSRYGLFLNENSATLRLVAGNDKSFTSQPEGDFENSERFKTGEVHLNFVGAKFSAPPIGEDELQSKVNYFVGNDSSRWQSGVPTFAKVRYKAVYPGVDVLFYGNQRELEYDFIVAPRTAPQKIELEFEGAEKVTINKNGELVLHLQNGEILQRQPVAYQMIDGVRREVSAKFVKKGKKSVAFRLGKYNRDKELVIDPIIVFSTYFGGNSAEYPATVETDAEGNIYLTGGTVSANFPTKNPLQPANSSAGSFLDTFVTKINPTGSAVIFSTYLGGSSDDLASTINIDQEGNVIVTGRTASANFPTVNALQPQLAGGLDGFISKLKSDGSVLVYSTYLGGSTSDSIYGSAIDPNGNPVVVGSTDSGDFPIVNAFQPARAGASFFRSTTGGSSFSAQNISPLVTTIFEFAFNSNSPDTVFAATNRGIYRSMDGGTNWSAAGTADLSSSISKVVVAPSNPNILYATSSGRIFKSVNGGDNWTSIQGNLFTFYNTIAVDPNNADIVYIAGLNSAVTKTTNGGATWTNMFISGTSAQVLSLVIDPVNTQIIYAGNTQRIYKSTVGGGGWTNTSGTILSTSFYDLLIDPATNTIYAAAQSGLYKSTDAGANWTHVNVSFLNSVRSLAQDTGNPANLYTVTNTGLFFRSQDSGVSWSQINNGLTGNVLLAVEVTANAVFLGGNNATEAFVTRLNADGSALNYSTFLGASLNESAVGVGVDGSGKIIVAGNTNSPGFPVANAVQPVLGGSNDAFMVKFDESGTALIYSTFLGGSSNETASSMKLDTEGNAYLTGNTSSVNFPVRNALQPSCASCATGPSDAFLTKLNADGSALIYSTFLGGASADNGLSIDVDLQNQPIVGGSTASNNFPIYDAIQPAIAGGTDGFVSKFEADGSGFIYSTYVGGTSTDIVTGVNIAPEGNVVILGQTSSLNFPVVRPLQNASGGGQDIFLAKIGSAANLEIITTDENDPVMVNNPLTYNFQIKNAGPSEAVNVIVTDVLPAGTNFVSATSTHGDCTIQNSTLTCNLGNLPLNAQAVVRLFVIPTQTGVISNTPTVRSDVPDPIATNNSDTEQTLISAAPSISGRLTQSGGQPAGEVGVSITGFQNRNLQTDTVGKYQAAELPLGGNYTVRPSKKGFYFSPRSKSYSSLTKDETADFVIYPCVYTLSANTVNIAAGGGSQSISLTSNDPFCEWTAVSNAPWISVTSGASGFGNGIVRFSIQPTSVSRTGTLTIAGKSFTVTQSGCSFTLTPWQESFGASGGTGTITITANQSFCQWTAAASDPWITVTQGNEGTGSGTISYTVASTEKARRGRIMVAGQSFAIYQELNFCPEPGFGNPIETLSTSKAFDIVAADFNNDGFPDIGTVDETSSQTGNFTVHRAIGDGTFSPNPLPTNIGPLKALALGHFNADSNVDVAVVGSGQISIYFSAGNGPVTLSSTFNAVTGSEVFAEDFNRDGKTDLLIGNPNGFYLYYGAGNGTFTSGPNYQVGGRYTYSFAVGDLNGDGLSDVVARNEQDFNIYRLVYFLGSSNGTFSPAGTVSLGSIWGSALKIGDFNGDGKGDVVTNGIAGSQVLILLWNAAANDFHQPLKVFTEAGLSTLIETADIDNDGKLDIVTTSSGYSGRLNLLRGNGNGTFRQVIGFRSVNNPINAMTFADFNRDGRTDIAFAKEINRMAVQLHQCNSSGTYTGPTKFDFDGDKKAEVAVIRPTDNTWHFNRSIDQSMTGQQFGADGDIFVPADYDGDGRTDIAVFRPNEGIWYRQNSSDNAFVAQAWGQNGDKPVPGDFDGDGRADLAVFRPENRVWYWLSSLTGQIQSTQFGLSTDKPVVSDYDGDGKADIAVFRPSDGTWYVLRSRLGIIGMQFGVSSDQPVVGDYDGDGKADPAVFRNGVWYMLRSQTGFASFQLGLASDKPVPADYDGDGKTDAAVFRDGNWYSQQSSAGFTGIQFGQANDKPVPSVYIP